MKRTKMFIGAASLATILASLVGCESATFEQIGPDIVKGDKSYSTLMAERVNPWGTNAVTLSLVESDHKVVEQRPQYVYVRPSPPCAPAPACTPAPAPARTCAPLPPAPAPVCAHEPVPQDELTIVCQGRHVEVLYNTHVVNNNNASSIGWANGAFQGSVGAAIEGGMSMGAAALIRPSRVSVRGGGASSSSSSSSSASGG